VEYDRWECGKNWKWLSINFDSNDRIRRIGSIQMSYNRFALERVGGLEIIYNRRGQVVDIYGSVKGGGDAHNQDNNHRYLSDRRSNDNRVSTVDVIIVKKEISVLCIIGVKNCSGVLIWIDTDVNSKWIVKASELIMVLKFNTKPSKLS
jgi:hypothetical protein